MIIVMKAKASQDEVKRVQETLQELGFGVHLSEGVERTIIGALGNKDVLVAANIETLPGVERVVPIRSPYKLGGKEFHPAPSVVEVKGAKFGGGHFSIIAGPCAVESREQLLKAAEAVKKAGASLVRGGAFKPRTSPYSFQGLEEEGLKILKEASEVTGLGVVTEVVDPKDVELVSQYVDALQVGARNMQNFVLLRAVGRAKKPVILKRGLSATISEWLMAAEYIMSEGNHNVILCERGIRTFETATRNTLDISAVPVVKELSHLPIIIDPSHSGGHRQYVQPLALAAVAAGADGLMVEVHPDPEKALSDGPQSLTPPEFEELVNKVGKLKGALDFQ
ncbi:MAG: 3-deoxy-7-phosphoheptulonate synthase [Bacillota bacterium]|jgi:3-deoxy-7-phosphoheptulonate synthase|nr:3-deoxy-7-phosphoheptulonate synthase [Bacillota bacterium]NLU53946.1 3-deoxy-7-phosphoheptulonate synthase [Bacillota bacterium]HOA90858.1 3-deoxy-7-phosphoheptulonate synthase [Bacillota bacterium]HPZ72539.1 3-deoxy-7-phosphoheptulonate synthase [Bacillota bacterium]HQD77506.1 3-deoxy-7-phosphoheptulonate synthase [Bacillota bacterium]